MHRQCHFNDGSEAARPSSLHKPFPFSSMLLRFFDVFNAVKTSIIFRNFAEPLLLSAVVAELETLHKFA